MAVGWRQQTRNGFDLIEIEAGAGRCTVALHGAQVLSYTSGEDGRREKRGQEPGQEPGQERAEERGQEPGEDDWFWLSGRARWSARSALRGGVPICFPWFGPHPTESSLPAHGFARTRLWRLASLGEADNEAEGARVRALFELGPDPENAALFPYPFVARYAVTVGPALELALEVENQGERPFDFEAALHSYLAVSDLAAISIAGLGGCDYIDKAAGGARRRQDQQPLRIEGEVDRVYDHPESLDEKSFGRTVVLTDLGRSANVAPGSAPTLARALVIESVNARSTIVWNPGPERARSLGDLEPDGFRKFVCIETGNVGERRVRLPPGGRHTLSVRYRRA
jgi:glucose-6-phosphate 1-epimerase